MIEILPETEDRILVVKASEKLTRQDYEEIFIPQLNQRLDKYGSIRVLFLLSENFNGWELGAAWDDAVFGVKHRHDFEKIAIVSDQKWVKWATKVGSFFMDGQAATYASSELQDAVKWVKK